MGDGWGILVTESMADRTTQLNLFEPASRPEWWGEQDTAAVRAWLDLREQPGPNSYMSEQEWEREALRWSPQWRCRRCAFWQSKDGLHGNCEAGEDRRGWTAAAYVCAQWEPRLA